MPIIDNLVNYWSMSGASGATEEDAHGSLDLSQNGTVGSAAGLVGDCRTFNGSSQYLEGTVGAVPFDGAAGPWTLVFWFESGSISQIETYILMSASDVGGTDQAGVIYEYVNNTIEFYSANYSGTDPRTDSGISLADTNWHMVAYRKNAFGASSWDKFLDGNKTQINASIDFTLPSTLDRFVVGAAVGPTSYVNGSIDEVGWWTGALTDEQIAWLYNGGAGRSYAEIQAGETDSRSDGRLVIRQA
jgi:hypothetical protein